MLIRPTILFALILALFALPSPALAQRQWLTGDPTPLRYEIAVTPDAEAGTFAGEARIIVESAVALSSVTMNALDLEIASARIDNTSATFALDPAAQTLTLTPRRPLAPGRHTIRIVYRGKIFDDAYGLFRVSYEAGGQTKRALATQFEVGDARRLAPLWDQPNRRAVFSLTVTAPTDQMVISNMPAQQVTRVAGGKSRTRFADTPSMSSYLLFLAMGDFERVTRDIDGVELGVVMRSGERARAGLALDAGEQSLRYFTEYFGVRYPLPKLDMVAVPGAGGFAAMENWGAILYFDQYLLLDEQSSEAERQNVFGIVAHEIAHQWFGNLVTMEWWDDLWLNEGFASWMAAKATEAIHPDWAPWLAQLTDGTAAAMSLDARVGTHPVVQTVNTIDEANLAFDAITYQKGLAVIRMIEAYVGEDGFRRGVRDYINAHTYGNARTEDLWTAIQAASGEPVLAIARSFTGQPGFPVLSAHAACDRRQGALLTLRQRRFAMDEASRTGETWEIPVVARTLSGAPRRGVLDAQASASVPLSDCGPYIVNAGQSGLYRVLYERGNFTELAARFAQLDKADQLGLLLDYWAFGRSGDAPFTDYLDLVSAIPADADPVIVMDTASSMLAFADYAKDRPSESAVRAYGRRTLRPFFDRLGWSPHTNELANHTLARAQLISALGALGDDEIIAEARRRAASAESDPTVLPGAIRAAVLGVQALNATPSEYEAMLAQARAAKDFVEQRRLWLTLAGARDEALARRSLDLVLGEEIPRQVRTQVVASVSGRHPRLAWDFVVANREAIEALLDPLSRLEYPGDIASASADARIADELEIYARNFPEGAMASVASSAATIRLRAQTVAERMPAVEAWIAARERPPARGRAAR